MINPITNIDLKKKELERQLRSARAAVADGVHAVNHLFRGLRRKVNRNPLGSLAVAAAIGVLAGASWKTTR